MNIKDNRIEFIDLAKGVCIILIILGHTGITVDLPGLSAMRTPLYFALSGLFFKDYGGLQQLLIRKCNKILIPFLFFYIGSYAIFYVCNALFPGLIVSDAKGILDVFTQSQYFNGPIWFLLALFWCNIFFCIISLNINKEYLRCAMVVAMFAIGYFLEKESVFLPCMIDVSFIGMPFFYFGYILKKSPLLYPNKWDRYNIIFAILLFTTAYITDKIFTPIIYFHDKYISGNLLALAILSSSSVAALLLLCKSIKRMPIVSYIGRYSIIPLCTHHLIYRPIQLVVRGLPLSETAGNCIVAATTIILCMITIPLCIKYLPYFTAQKDVINSGKK